jgi:hypothetical protein
MRKLIEEDENKEESDKEVGEALDKNHRTFFPRKQSIKDQPRKRQDECSPSPNPPMGRFSSTLQPQEIS